jgi:hypothetical protein
MKHPCIDVKINIIALKQGVPAELSVSFKVSDDPDGQWNKCGRVAVNSNGG